MKKQTLKEILKNIGGGHLLEQESSTGVLGALEQILVAWEDNVYPDDKTRWNDYYHDIEQLVVKIKSGEVK